MWRLALAAALLVGCESTPILLYHSVGEPAAQDRWVGTEQLREQLEDLLDDGYAPITASELDQIELHGAARPPRPIVITFDDGYRNFRSNAVPVLRDLGVRATLFVPTGWIGESDAERTVHGQECLTWPELRALAAEGIEVQSHSVTHTRMRALSADEVRAELEDSKRVLEAQLGTPVTVFAYPGGSFTEDIERAAERAGYESALSVSSGLNGRFDRQRISVHAGDDRRRFKRMIEGSWWGASSGQR